jgi:hypothetical protein
MSEHEQWDELAAGYALHGLSPADEELFVTHLEGCTDCAASLNEHELVAAQLGSISHYQDLDEAPSWESMRDRILGPRTEAPAVVDLAEHRRRYDISRRVLAAAAAVVIVAGGGIAIWRVASGGSGCSAASGCHQIQLDAGSKTLASLVVHNNRVTVTPTNMPAAPTGKIYVLWQQPLDGQATPISEFTAQSGAADTVDLHDPYTKTAAFAVSLETRTGTLPTHPSDTLASGST